MARIQPLGTLTFNKPTATDVTGFRLYYRDEANGPAPLTYDDTFIAIEAADVDDNSDGTLSIDLSNPDIVFEAGVPADGAVLFALTAIDDAGNESDMSEAVTVPFDVEAPAAITGLSYSA